MVKLKYLEMKSIELKCCHCGNSFNKSLGEYNRQIRDTKGLAKFFCDSSCSAKSRGKIKQQIQKTCKCGNTFTTSTESKHCSVRCASFYSMSPSRKQAMLKAAINSRFTKHETLEVVANALRAREWHKYTEIDSILTLMERDYQFEYNLPGTRFIYDLAIFDSRLLIEFDEKYHLSIKKQDAVKDLAAIENGWELIRIDVRELQAPYPQGLVYFLFSNGSM